MEKECVICGKIYQVKPSHADKRVTCSRGCVGKLLKEKLKGKNNPHWRGGDIEKTCPYCGKAFYVSCGLKKIRKYCSRACAGLGRRTSTGRYREKKPRKINPHLCKLCGKTIPLGRIYCETCSPRGKSKIISYCQVCGKPFEHWKGYLRKFCSRKCYVSQQHGEGNPNWKGGRLSLAQLIRASDKNRKLIARILIRDKYTCQICGQVGGDLEVDHIKPFSDILEDFLQKYAVLDLKLFQSELFSIALKYKPFWDKNNLRTLCRRCNWQRQVERNSQ